MSDLDVLRGQIDEIDARLIKIFAERFKLTHQIGSYKKAQKLPARDKERERQKEEALAKLARQHGLDEELIQRIYRLLFEEVVKEHREIS